MEKTMTSLPSFLSFLPRAAKFPLPLPLLTSATQAMYSAVCLPFIGGNIFLPMADDQTFYVVVSKCRMNREFCCLYKRENHKFSAPVRAPCSKIWSPEGKLFAPLGSSLKYNAICFKLFWYKVFVHWKLKLINFLVDSILIRVLCFSYVVYLLPSPLFFF